MQTYKYHPETKEFLYSEEAFIDPMETAQFVPIPPVEKDDEGDELSVIDDRLERLEEATQKVYLLPADSTFTEPLIAKEGYAVCWNGTVWEYIEDHRQKQDRSGEHPMGQGTPYWLSGDTWKTPARYMTELGKLPEGAILTVPEKPAEVIAQEALSQAKSARAQAVSQITVEIDGMVFDGDEAAQERMSRAVVLADSMNETTEWVLHDNTVAIVTADQLRRACKAAGKAQTILWTKPYKDTTTTSAEQHYTLE